MDMVHENIIEERKILGVKKEIYFNNGVGSKKVEDFKSIQREIIVIIIISVDIIYLMMVVVYKQSRKVVRIPVFIGRLENEKLSLSFIFIVVVGFQVAEEDNLENGKIENSKVYGVLQNDVESVVVFRKVAQIKVEKVGIIIRVMIIIFLIVVILEDRIKIILFYLVANNFVLMCVYGFII